MAHILYIVGRNNGKPLPGCKRIRRRKFKSLSATAKFFEHLNQLDPKGVGNGDYYIDDLRKCKCAH